MSKKYDGKKILGLPMAENDAGADTVGGYLVELLRKLWREREGFSGKRPFGNGGWDCDLYKPLITAKVIKGALDSDGYVEDVDPIAAAHAIDAAIDALMPA